LAVRGGVPAPFSGRLAKSESPAIIIEKGGAMFHNSNMFNDALTMKALVTGQAPPEVEE
jgi:hypothetical protein